MCVHVWEGGGACGYGQRKISDSLIIDAFKTLIKIEYSCKCNLQVFHLEQLSQCGAVFMSFFTAHK